jgi:hypothetical protein
MYRNIVTPDIPPAGEGAPCDASNMIINAQQHPQQTPPMSLHFLSSAPAQSKTGVRLNDEENTRLSGGIEEDDTEDDDTEDDDTEDDDTEDDDIILYVY